MKKIIILCLFISLQLFELAAQQIPKIIPPSPIAQAFMRYGEIPVDYSTGVPSISIPLYTIKGKKLELPISISYHASGIKVNDVASEVGLGWVLNCGGIVSRSVFGIPDDQNPTKAFSSASALLQSAVAAGSIFDQSCSCLRGLYNFEDQLDRNESGQDYMSDRFSYSLPNGTSGVFRYDYSNSNNIITLPYRPLKIEKFLDSPALGNYAKINRIKITDENGIVYIFEPFLNNTPQYYSEWYLKKMMSSDGTDIIELFYTLQAPNTSGFPVDSYVLTGAATNVDNTSCSSGNLFSTISRSISQSSGFNTPVLDHIVSSTAIITFSYTNDRSDFSQLKRLSDMTISPVNSPTTIIKSIHFTPKYFGTNSTNYRLGLDNVTISAPGNTQPQTYAFTYENQTLPPYPPKMNIPTYGEDFWGYYNGANSPTLIPSDFILNSSDNSYGGNRNPDQEYSRACMIKQIKYPTGGKTVFQFERNFSQNVYPYKYPNNTDGYVGGFRIGSITNYNEKNEVVGIKTYEYSGVITKQIKRESFVIDQCKATRVSYSAPSGGESFCYNSYSNEMIFSNPILPIEVGVGLPIMYTKVIEYNGTKTNNAGKTVYEYNQPNSPSDFDNNTHPFEWELPSYYHPFHYDRGNYVPELRSKTIYTFDGTNYHPVSKTRNTYTPLYTQEYSTGIKLTRDIQYSPYYFSFSLYNPNNSPLINNSETIAKYLQSIAAIDTKAYQEASLLTKSENYTYNPTDSTNYVMGSTDLEYEPNYTRLIKQTTSTSVSDKNKITQFTYPFNYNTAPYTTMVGLNNVAPVIEQSDFIGTNFLQSMRTNYGFSQSNTIIEPSSVELKSGSNNYETRLVYENYDSKGNPQYIYKDDAIKNVYLWSYNGEYPVAKIEGLTYNEVSSAVGSYAISSLFQNPSPTLDDLNLIRGNINNSGKTALVTTYTYKPLVGISSMTDPLGVVTNYTYDTFNRLYLVRNDDKSIVGQYRYGYLDAPDNGQGGYSSLYASITPEAGGTNHYIVTASGGSGNYVYKWCLKNSSGEVIGDCVNTTSSIFGTGNNELGASSLECTITDESLGASTIVSIDLAGGGNPQEIEGSFIMQGGFSDAGTYLYAYGPNVQYALTFIPNYYTIWPGYTMLVATVPQGAQPATPQTSTYYSDGRTWLITFNPDTSVVIQLVDGPSAQAGYALYFYGYYQRW